jgi:hypothetical protein
MLRVRYGYTRAGAREEIKKRTKKTEPAGFETSEEPDEKIQTRI